MLVSNAALQWVPDHRALLPGLVDALAPGGWLAFQVPGNYDAPSHRALRALAAEPPFAAHTAEVVRPVVAEPADYLADLAGAGLPGRRVGDDLPARAARARPGPALAAGHRRPALPRRAARGAAPVVHRGAGPRLARRTRPQPWGTVLPFRRLFVVAQPAATAARPAGEAA